MTFAGPRRCIEVHDARGSRCAARSTASSRRSVFAKRSRSCTPTPTSIGSHRVARSEWPDRRVPRKSRSTGFATATPTEPDQELPLAATSRDEPEISDAKRPGPRIESRARCADDAAELAHVAGDSARFQRQYASAVRVAA